MAQALPAVGEICLGPVTEQNTAVSSRAYWSSNNLQAYDAPALSAFLYGQNHALLFDGNALLPRDRFEGLEPRRPPYGNSRIHSDHPATVSPSGQVVTYGYQGERGSLKAHVYLYDPAARRFDPVPGGELGKTRVRDVIWSEAFGAFLFATKEGVFEITVENGEARIAPPVARLGRGGYVLTDIPELEVVLVGFDESTLPIRLNDPMRFFALTRDGIEPIDLPVSRYGVWWLKKRLAEAPHAISVPPAIVYSERRPQRGTQSFRIVPLARDGARVVPEEGFVVSREAVWIISGGRFIKLSGNPGVGTSIGDLRVFDGQGLRPLTRAELGDLSDLPPETSLRSVRGSPLSRIVGLRAGDGIYLFDDSGIPRHATTLSYEDLGLKGSVAPNEINWQASQSLGVVFANASRRKKGWVHEFGGATLEVTPPFSENVTDIFRAFFIEQHRETLIDLGDRRIVVRIAEICN
jgi:hypothetical protein